jgi:hypothetical protein
VQFNVICAGNLNSILDTSKAESGKMQLDEVEFSLADVLEESMDMINIRLSSTLKWMILALGSQRKRESWCLRTMSRSKKGKEELVWGLELFNLL